MEHWKAVVGYEELYEVSDQGRVRSIDRMAVRSNGFTMFAKGRVLRARLSSTGRFGVTLYNNSKGRNGGTSKDVHVLVATAFVPNPRNLPQVNHKDTNYTNNCATNLEWRAQQGNMQHAVKNDIWGDGVCFDKSRNKWMARHSPQPNKRKNLGRFSTFAEAKTVRDAAVANMKEMI